MVYRYDFNIVRPDSRLTLGAAGLGERMRANRAREAFAQQQAEATAQQRQVEQEKYSREQIREGLGVYRQGVEGIMKNLPPEARPAAYSQFLAQVAPGYPEGMFATVPQEWNEEFAARTVAQVPPPAPDDPAAIKIAKWYENAPPGLREAFDATKAAGRPTSTTLPAPVFRTDPATGDTVAVTVDPQTLQARTSVVFRGKDPEAEAAEKAAQAVQVDTARQQAETQESIRPLDELLDRYEQLAKNAQRDPTGQFIVDREAVNEMERLKAVLGNQLANVVITTPGDAPAELQVEEGKMMVPEIPSGPLDRYRFESSMRALRSAIKAAKGEENGEQRQSISEMPYEALVDRASTDDKWLNSLSEEQYQALEERLRRGQ